MLKQAIYKYFEDQEKKEHERSEVINFAPSYFTNCQRQIYYKKTYTKPSNPIETHSYIKFAMGNSIHDKIQDIFNDMGILIESEVDKEKNAFGLFWRYRVDAIIKDQQNNKYICEIKTVYASGYNSIENEPKPEHIYQLLLYMLLERIPKGVLLYVGRDNGYIVEYYFDLNSIAKYKERLKKGLKRFHDLHEDIKNNELPNRSFQIALKNYKGNITTKFQYNNQKYSSSWRCDYCQWYNLCWQKELEEIKNHDFYIDGQFIDKE